MTVDYPWTRLWNKSVPEKDPEWGKLSPLTQLTITIVTITTVFQGHQVLFLADFQK